MADSVPELASLSIFGALKAEALEHIERLLERQSHPPKSEILREGEEGRGLHVVIQGMVEIILHLDDGPQVIARLGDGAVFGEMSIIDIMPRSASVVAMGEVHTLYLSRQAFFSLCSDAPSTFAMVSLNLARELSRRLRCANVLLAEAGLTHHDDTYLHTLRKKGKTSPAGE